MGENVLELEDELVMGRVLYHAHVSWMIPPTLGPAWWARRWYKLDGWEFESYT